MYYVPNNNNKKDDTKTLYYAPSTDPEYENTPFLLDRLKSAVMGGRSNIKNSGSTRNGQMIPIRRLNGNEDDDTSVIFVVDDDSTAPFIGNDINNSQTASNGDSFFMAKSFTTTIQENTFFGNIISSPQQSSNVVGVQRPSKTKPQQQKQKVEEIKKTEYKPNSALKDLPNAIGYATSLSVAGFASGMTMAAKTLSAGLEHGAKLTQSLEHSFVDVATQFKDHDDFSSSVFQNLRNTFHQGTKQLQHDFEYKPIPELVQSFFDHVQPNTAAATSFFDNLHVPSLDTKSSKKGKKQQKPKIASVPAPLNKEYYTPFEACNILYHHEMDPMLDKPKAMKILLENKYIPVGRSQIYRVFRQFKQGKIQEGKMWGERGRPRKVPLLA